MSSLTIRTWTENFPSQDGVAVVFDIFRCTTTLHCLHSRAPGELLVGKSLRELHEEKVETKNSVVFSELSQAIECSQRFDNSPLAALEHPMDRKSKALVATTTGTPAMFAARAFRKVFLGSLVNFSALVTTLAKLKEPITLVPAAIPDWAHVEDEIAAQAVATALYGYAGLGDFVRACGENAKEKILASHRVPDLVRKLPKGKEDTSIALDIDRYPFVLSLDFASVPHPLLARVQEEE